MCVEGNITIGNVILKEVLQGISENFYILMTK